MGRTLRSFLVFSISSFALSGCLHRADSLQLLEVRADYDGKAQSEAESLKLGDGTALREIDGGVPVRTAPKIAHVWIFPHETPSKEYFWGGWISLVVEGDKWEVERPVGLFPDKPGNAAPQASAKSSKSSKTKGVKNAPTAPKGS
jgi:hypothetical protein